MLTREEVLEFIRDGIKKFPQRPDLESKALHTALSIILRQQMEIDALLDNVTRLEKTRVNSWTALYSWLMPSR